MSAKELPKASPAELPLPGGSEGATLTLRPLLSAVMRGPAAWFESRGGPLAAPLAALGIDAADVGVIVMTHLHFDHASALCDFPASTVLVSSAEWAAASRGGALNGYVAAQLDARPNYRTIDFSSAAAMRQGA